MDREEQEEEYLIAVSKAEINLIETVIKTVTGEDCTEDDLQACCKLCHGGATGYQYDLYYYKTNLGLIRALYNQDQLITSFEYVPIIKKRNKDNEN